MAYALKAVLQLILILMEFVESATLLVQHVWEWVPQNVMNAPLASSSILSSICVINLCAGLVNTSKILHVSSVCPIVETALIHQHALLA